MRNYVPVDFDPFSGLNEIEKITLANEPQREIWLSCVIGGDEANMSYNESASLRMTGELNVAALKHSIDELVLRHEALRATVSPNGETLIIYRNVPVALSTEDISTLPEGERDAAFKAFLNREVNTPMSLQEGPLFKVYLHRTGAQEHYFTIIKHHIIGDGWSTGVILEDLGRMYNAYEHSEEPDLDPASQISDYASAQAAYKFTPAYKETEGYWLNEYRGDMPVVDLPVDRPRPSPRTYKGNRVDHPLSRQMVDELKGVGAKAGSSLVTTLLAAFEVLLYQLTNQDDLVVGLPASGQAATGLTDVVGHCVNLLPLRTHINPAEPFTDYLKRRKKEVLDAYDHQQITFGELLRKLVVARDPSRIPLAPVMFNIDMGMDNAVAFEGLEYKLISNPRSYENFEIYLNATGSKDGIVLEWSYNTDLFDSATIEAYHASYFEILKQIVADASGSIERLAGDSTGVVLSGKDVPVPIEATINSLFADTVKKYAGKVAVSMDKEEVTYAQLDERVGRMTGLLISQGVMAGDIVGLCCDRSIDMLVCLMAVLRRGGVYLPLDPEYPAERISFMLQDSQSRLLLVGKRYAGKYASGVREVVIEDAAQQPRSGGKAEALCNGGDMAYVLYTSGSTGKPKGVQVTHGNLVNFLLSMQAEPGITETDRLLAITSISFDIAGLELYLPLIAGAELVIADNDEVKDGRLLTDIVERKRITVMQATPSTWQMMLDSGWLKQYKMKVLAGGEALPPELAARLFSLSSELWNMYGPTETTIWSTLKRVIPGGAITIGRPINNTRVCVVDKRGRPLPAGKEGEICIGGAGVAAGYLGRPDLTAERFVPDAWKEHPGGRLYRTGDLGKVLRNGELVCMGRMDHQVKIRGHRIELGEIESAVQQQGGVKQCVVLAREDMPGDKRIVAYVTLDEQEAGGSNPSWKERWDTLYDIGAEDQGTEGGTSTIDGALLEHLVNREELIKESNEWLRTSVERIKEIGARRIYEIGSGAGQILFALAPGADYYLATDYAKTAIDKINERLKAEPEQWARVHAAASAADDFSALGNKQVDLVLINSVVQYFPTVDYLLEVIRKAVGAIAEGGCLFIGDMQGSNSLAMFHAMDYLPRAAATTTVSEFMAVVTNRVRIEEELVADPAFFYLLPKLVPEITAVDVQLRKGQSLNETTKYHYDIWLYVGKRFDVAKAEVSKLWSEVRSLEELVQTLDGKSVIEIQHIPNARTYKDFRLWQDLASAHASDSIHEIRKAVGTASGGIDPDAVWEVGKRCGYRTHLRWTSDGMDGTFDAVFIPEAAKTLLPAFAGQKQLEKDVYSFARAPQQTNEIHLSNELVGSLKAALASALPAYMIPDDFVGLKKFPLTPNAKIDRKALPRPQQRRSERKEGDQRALTTEERLIADIWSETLGMEGLSPTDDFFQLGGHSLLAVKVMVAIEKRTGKRLTITTLFEHPTIEKLAAQLSGKASTRQWDSLAPIKTTGSKVPLFLVHGGDLNVLLFKSIYEYFDAEQPLYGIQALGLSHETEIPETIEGIAARYAADITDAYPQGPYAIAGYSLGGFFAFEIAKQLKQKGKHVAFVGIIDTYAGNNYDAGGKLARTAKKVVRQFRKVPFVAKSFIQYPKETLDYQLMSSKRVLRQLQSAEHKAPEDKFTAYEMTIYQKYSDALDAYLLTPADMSVVLFRVKKRLYFVDDMVTLGWKNFVKGGITVREVPGDHKTFLYPPFSKQFAAEMQQALDAAMHQ